MNPDPAAAAKMNSFGKANRAQTPVKGIITGTYGEEAEVFYKRRSEETFNRVSALLPLNSQQNILTTDHYEKIFSFVFASRE